MSWSTFIAIGDSFTEGLEDGPGADLQYIGWADRVARSLTDHEPSLRYANLAVRGRLLDEVVADQLPRALAHGPDLLSFHAGGNDVLRPRTEVADVVRRYDAAVAQAVAAVESVLLFTVLERSGGRGRAADRLAARLGAFNEGVRRTAAEHGALLVDVARAPALQDRRLWAPDRLHLATEGHRRVAAAVLERLGVPTAHPDPAWWRSPLPPPRATSRVELLADDLRWVGGHLLPWLVRRLRGISSGDGRTGKRPRPARV